MPRRFRRLAGAAWRQPTLDAARRARSGRGGGGGGGRARRGAAESRHCCLEGREIGGYLEDVGELTNWGGLVDVDGGEGETETGGEEKGGAWRGEIGRAHV